MKVKMLLRFYFSAQRIDAAINNLIFTQARAPSAFVGGGEAAMEKIIYLIADKDALGDLWAYLHQVMTAFVQDEQVLRAYAFRRKREDALLTRRVVMRFRRHAWGYARFSEALKILPQYLAFCNGR